MVELSCSVAFCGSLLKASPTESSPTVTCHWTTVNNTHTQTQTAEPFSLTEPLAHSAQLVPESTLELHIWCQCSVRGRPSGWKEGGGDRNRDGESKERQQKTGLSSTLYHSMYARKNCIYLFDVLYAHALRALVLFRVRGLNVKSGLHSEPLELMAMNRYHV